MHTYGPSMLHMIKERLPLPKDIAAALEGNPTRLSIVVHSYQGSGICTCVKKHQGPGLSEENRFANVSRSQRFEESPVSSYLRVQRSPSFFLRPTGNDRHLGLSVFSRLSWRLARDREGQRRRGTEAEGGRRKSRRNAGRGRARACSRRRCC